MTHSYRAGQLNRGAFRMGLQHAGEGETVILLHGFGLDRRSMLELANALVDQYRVVLPDWRGHGESRCPPRDELYSYPLMLEDLKALMNALKIERAHLVGHSMGGQIALMMALDEPERVLSFTALGSGHCRAVTTEREKNMWTQTADYFAAANAPKLLRALCAMTRMSENARNKPSLPQLYTKARGAELASVIRGAFMNVKSNEDACKALKPPALVMAGMDDLDWHSHSQQLSRLLPTSRWASIPDAGHLAHLEQPEAVARLIREFLDLSSTRD